MRLAGILVAVALVMLAVSQFIIGRSGQGTAGDSMALAASDICIVDAMTQPVLRTETRQIVTTPAHQSLIVTDAIFGTRTETVTVTPAHRVGATFFTEQKRVIISEPTRRLRATEPVFGIAPDIDPRTVQRFHVEGGVLTEETDTLPSIPGNRIVVKKARIEAVRVNAGLKMIETRIIDQDGSGDPVAAETMEVEVRTIETHPSVETHESPAVTEMVEVEVVETPPRRIQVDALCATTDHEALIRRVKDVLSMKGVDGIATGALPPATIDAIAAEQASTTGLVSPDLLIRTLRLWVPETRVPTT